MPIPTNQQVQAYLTMPKQFTVDELVLPPSGQNSSYELIGIGTGDKFRLSVYMGRIRVRFTFHCMNNSNMGIFRLDINGSPHFCNDTNTKERSHIHYYVEGHELKNARSLPDNFSQLSHSIVETTKEVLNYLNINPIVIQANFL